MALTKITRGVIKANENYDTHNINSTGIVTAVSANFTGNVSIGGTLTYQDVTNIDSVGVITARAGVKVPDSQRIFVGTDDDLVFYHDGTRSRIHDSATNATFFTTNALHIRNNADNETMAKFTADGAVELYHDNTKRFQTSSAGVEVSSGNLTMQSNGRIFVGNGGNAVNPMFANVSDTNTGIAFPAADTMLFTTGGSERLRIDSSGRLNIGSTSAPGTVGGFSHINVHGTGINANGAIALYRNGTPTTGQGIGAIYFANSAGNPGAYIQGQSDGTWGTNDYPGRLAFFTTSDSGSSSVERVRIDSSGRLIVGGGSSPPHVGDGQLIVYSSDRLHPAIKAAGTSSNVANGYTVLGDNYASDESHFTIGLSYSAASLVIGYGVKASGTADNEYLSSQDSYATKHSAIKHDHDGWRFLSNSSSQTVTTDSVVSLTERIRISTDGKILKGITSSILGNSDVQLAGSGGPATVAGYKSDNNPTGNSSMLTVTGYSQSGGTFTGIGEIDFKVQQGSNTASGYHPGSILTRVNGGSTTGTHAGAAYSYAGLKDRERITVRSKRYYALPEWVSGSDTYNLFREEWDYQHYVGFNRYSWYRFTSHSSSSSRGGSVDIRLTWSTRHAAGNGYGHWAFHWRDNHGTGYMDIGNVYKYHSSYLGGSYYGWSSNPNLHVYEINDNGNVAGFYLRVQGHIDANSSTYDGGVMHQFLISAHTNRLGADVNKFEFVGNSTPSDAGSQQGNVNLP